MDQEKSSVNCFYQFFLFNQLTKLFLFFSPKFIESRDRFRLYRRECKDTILTAYYVIRNEVPTHFAQNIVGESAAYRQSLIPWQVCILSLEVSWNISNNH